MEVIQTIQCPHNSWQVFDKDYIGELWQILLPEIELDMKLHECEQIQVFGERLGLKRYFIKKLKDL